jgi:hypothetical protein
MNYTDTIRAITYMLLLAEEFDCIILESNGNPTPEFRARWDDLEAEHRGMVQRISDADHDAFVDILDAR